MRTQISIAVFVVGIILLFAMISDTVLYRYRWLDRIDCQADKADLVALGWQVVPNQSDACYLRRLKLH